MGKIRTPILTTEQQTALEEGYRQGKRANFRQRCQMILLKAQGRTSREVGDILNFLVTIAPIVLPWLAIAALGTLVTIEFSKFDVHNKIV